MTTPKKPYKKNESQRAHLCESEEFSGVCLGAKEVMIQWRKRNNYSPENSANTSAPVIFFVSFAKL